MMKLETEEEGHHAWSQQTLGLCEGHSSCENTYHVVSGTLGAVETAVCSHVPGNLSGLQQYVYN